MTRDEKKMLRRLGNVVAIERMCVGLTLPALAKLARVSKGNLSRIERGGDLQVSTFYRICWALGIEPAQMVPNFKLPFRRKTSLAASKVETRPATRCARRGTGRRADAVSAGARASE